MVVDGLVLAYALEDEVDALAALFLVVLEQLGVALFDDGGAEVITAAEGAFLQHVALAAEVELGFDALCKHILEAGLGGGAGLEAAAAVYHAVFYGLAVLGLPAAEVTAVPDPGAEEQLVHVAGGLELALGHDLAR